MNHLRDLLAAKKAERLHEQGITVDEFLTSEKALSVVGERAMCFSVGDAWHAMPTAIVREICKQPFDTCWYEISGLGADGSTIVIGVLVHEANDTSWSQTWMREGRYWTLLEMVQKNKREFFFGPDPDVKYALVPSYRKEYWLDMKAILCAFLTAMNCCNVAKVEHHPDQAIQRAREKRGKAPLFSYWTLVLRADRTSGEPMGGTHASPRLHLRRGHPRQYAPGKYTWVQPHVVGNKLLGMVHKDYDGTRLSKSTAGMVPQ